jgi:Ca2+-binding EF-hand superfamily protein
VRHAPCFTRSYPLLTPYSRQAMIDEFDMDQDGEINEQEFFAIMTDDA